MITCVPCNKLILYFPTINSQSFIDKEQKCTVTDPAFEKMLWFSLNYTDFDVDKFRLREFSASAVPSFFDINSMMFPDVYWQLTQVIKTDNEGENIWKYIATILILFFIIICIILVYVDKRFKSKGKFDLCKLYFLLDF